MGLRVAEDEKRRNVNTSKRQNMITFSGGLLASASRLWRPGRYGGYPHGRDARATEEAVAPCVKSITQWRPEAAR